MVAGDLLSWTTDGNKGNNKESFDNALETG
jgi:hypothetical protein